ncbi:hypothetical protein EZS27_002417 [termite gut metagenome]|uniref:Uncharacterized protein n=1 Tax=termite gut metagenome TaxID=433724 RepID=A0A5J4SXF5_9ZZZZ
MGKMINFIMKDVVVGARHALPLLIPPTDQTLAIPFILTFSEIKRKKIKLYL